MIGYKRKSCIMLLLLLCSTAWSQCTPSSIDIEGQLIASALEDGFPTKLVSLEPLVVLMSCQTARVVIRVSSPVRLEDGGPKLKGPFEGFFIYEGKRYTDKQEVITDDIFQFRSIHVGMSISNDGAILPASDNYRYSVILTAVELER